MLSKQNKVTSKCISVYGVFILFFLLTVPFLGCDLVQQLVPPDTPDSAASVKIGFIYSPPDPGTTRNGAELAVALANEAGGINGLPIELLIRDDKRDPVLSTQHASELIDAGVLAIVGPDYSAVAVEVGAIVQQHGIPMVTTYPTNPNVTRNGNFSFMGAYTDPYQASAAADFAVQELNAMTAAVLTEIGSSYGAGLSNAFIERFTALGGTIAVQQFYETDATDFTEQLMAIVAVDPPVDVVFLGGLGPKFPLAVKQAKTPAIGITATFLGGDGWDRPDLVEIGGKAIEGSFFANHFSPGAPPEQLSEGERQFITAYTALFGVAPDGPAALGYDSTAIIIEAMRRSADMTPATIRDQIEATQNYSGAAMLSRFDENRHAIKSLVISTIKDGTIQFHQVLSP
jgi:branched-chain amino acid transport system substrate-binding protein